MAKNIIATIIVTDDNGVNTTVNILDTEMYNHIITNLRNGIKFGEAEIATPSKSTKKTTSEVPAKTTSKQTTAKKSTTAKKNTKPVAKKSDDDEFDYAEYIRIAKELDVIRLDGKPWKSMRTTIYAVMNGEMTMKQAEAAKAKVAKKFEKK